MLLSYEELAVALYHDGKLSTQDLDNLIPMWGDIEKDMHSKGYLRATGYDEEGYLCYVLTHEGYVNYRDTVGECVLISKLIKPKRLTISERIARWFI